MKIRIDLNPQWEEEEVVIRCRELNDMVKRMQDAIATLTQTKQTIVLYRGEAEYYVGVEEILFFETVENGMTAHTREHIYQAKYRLYELEEILPQYFVRVSKSAIVNTKEVYALKKSNLSTTSIVEFRESCKQVYVSRHYAKLLRDKLSEIRH